MNSKARITAIGSYVPNKIMSNDDLEKIVDTSDEWIVQRTGMKERRIAAENEFTSTLCIRAVNDLIKRYGVNIQDVDMIIVPTTTSDFAIPSTASMIQDAFGIPEAGAIDVNAACAGLTYGLHLANCLITSGLHRKVLVIAGETLSKVTDYTDRTSCVLFGDGAGAMLVEYDAEQPSFLSYIQDTKGSSGKHLYRTALRNEWYGEPLRDSEKMVQNGREVYKWATRTVPEGMEKLLEQANMKMKDLNWFVPHSANLRMIESICEKKGFPIEKVLTSMVYYGNTSSASIVLALDLAVKDGRLTQDDVLLLIGFGGGFTYTGLIVKWGVPSNIKE
ncbi:ketoacyl-ACP synthase III [Bacillus gobiensis]|uniref:ketoacyl-ACP synthase III n=1 Tax=Bacillus gobiensis TaxID=1441095 RepID=UPI003D1C326E